MVKKQSPVAEPQQQPEPEPPAVPDLLDWQALEHIGVKVKLTLIYDPESQEWQAELTSYIRGGSQVVGSSNDPTLDVLISRLISALKTKVEALRDAHPENPGEREGQDADPD